MGSCFFPCGISIWEWDIFWLYGNVNKDAWSLQPAYVFPLLTVSSYAIKVKPFESFLRRAAKSRCHYLSVFDLCLGFLLSLFSILKDRSESLGAYKFLWTYDNAFLGDLGPSVGIHAQFSPNTGWSIYIWIYFMERDTEEGCLRLLFKPHSGGSLSSVSPSVIVGLFYLSD